MVNFEAARKGDRPNMSDGTSCLGLCRHFLAACRVANKPYHTLIPKKQTRASWRAAYEKCESPRLPSSAEVEAYKHLQDENLCLPPVLKPPTGRPPKHKRHKSAIGQMNDRNKNACEKEAAAALKSFIRYAKGNYILECQARSGKNFAIG